MRLKVLLVVAFENGLYLIHTPLARGDGHALLSCRIPPSGVDGFFALVAANVFKTARLHVRIEISRFHADHVIEIEPLGLCSLLGILHLGTTCQPSRKYQNCQ